MTSPQTRTGRPSWALSAVLAAVIGPIALAGVAAGATNVATATPSTSCPCALLTTPVLERVNPVSTAALVSRSSHEETNASVKYGFTEDHGVLLRAAVTANAALQAVHRLWNPNGDFVWISDPKEVSAAVTKYNYTDQGVNFYASATPLPCTVPVTRYRKGNKHRLAVSAADRSALTRAGWASEGVRFHAAAPTAPVVTTAPTPSRAPTSAPTPPPPSTRPAETKFSIAVYPDTQMEVINPADTRYADRAKWLIANKANLNLKFMLSVGDNANWDTPAHEQYQVLSNGDKLLEDAGIPYSLQVGNHDTEATGGANSNGGSCRQEPANSGKCPNTHANQRDTHTINSYFDAARFGAVSGEFEANKIDNSYSTFAAAGSQWMVLDLELWPRTVAVDWAKMVVASHPNTNIIVATHSYLNSDCTIYGANGGYGDNSPQYLYDNLIKQYANIKMVFSGHVGNACQRTDVGVHGNTIHSFLNAFHSGTTNPIRLVTIDTAADSVSTRVYGPNGDVSYPQYNYASGSMGWVPAPKVTKVLTVVEENHSLAQMQAQMPYLYGQAKRYGYATAYTATRHPSLPNYLAIAGGSTFGVTDDNPPSSHPMNGASVFGAAIAAGRTAKSYQENATGHCQQTTAGRYTVKHNPWAYFVAERALCAAGDVPSGSYLSGALRDDIVNGRLPNVGEVTPNLDDDGHDGTLATADAWLSDWLKLIYASPDWQSGHLAVVITADEDDTTANNTVLTTVLDPSQNHHLVTTPLNHYSLTGLLNSVGHSRCLAAACTAPNMAQAFNLNIG